MPGAVHIQHRVERRQQTLAGGIGTLIRIEIHTGGVRAAPPRAASGPSEATSMGSDRSGTTPSTSRSRRIARRAKRS